MEYVVNGVKYYINSIWSREQHKETIIKKQQELKKGLVFEDSGMTVYTKTKPKIELSKGCKACKTGTWWCLFPGISCNVDCKFCPVDKPVIKHDFCDNSESYDKGLLIEDIKLFLDTAGDKLTGISYSGGEPFMYLDKICDVASCVQKTQKQIYQWCYTNGILVTEDKLKRLKDVGIEEVRIDLTATNFDEGIINKLQMIREIIGKVTVEVPAVPETHNKLINEKYINRITDLGVEQINIAEMMLRRGLNWKTYADYLDIYVYKYCCDPIYSPVYSRHITLEVMEYVINNKINILVNDCSNDAKNVQQVARKEYCPSNMR